MKKITLIKFLTLFIALFCAVNFGFGQMSDLIISEYGEGSSLNKYIEIFNGTGADVDLNNYKIWKAVNGNFWPPVNGNDIIDLDETLTNGDTYIIANGGANETILAFADLISGKVSWNGNDAVGLVKDNGAGTFILIDVVGVDGADPGNESGWDVAGTTTGTKDHILVRKSSICSPNTDWATSAGTTVANSEWIVLAQNNWSNIGTHTTDCCIYSSTWTSTGWTPSAPTINTSVTIDYDFNTTANGNFSACSLQVNTGFNLTLNNGDYIEVENDVVIDGELIIETQGNFVQNNDTATFADNTINGVVQQKKKTLQSWYSYTYWSSPVKDETIEGALSTTPVDRRFKFEAANFVDNDTEIGNTNTFIIGTPDGIDDDGNDWQFATGIMTPGVGYAATASEFGLPFPREEQFDFYGEFNNGEVSVSLVNNSGGAYDDWNFIGNPYPGAISADTFFTVNAGLVDVIYLWDQATDPSNTASGNSGYNFSADDYAMINGTGTVTGARGDTGLPPNRFVPSGQGFFVEALNAGNVIFNNSMRSITADNSQFFKSANSKNNTVSVNNNLWVNLTSDNGVFSQIMIGYVSGATKQNDGSFYDAKRALTSGNNAGLYSIIENDNSKFAIQGKAINSINKDEVINLGFNTTIDVPTIYTLSIAQLQGDFLTAHTIYLKDNLTNTLHDLSASDYTFTSEVGEFNTRFQIVFNAVSLSTDTFDFNANTVSILQVDETHVNFRASNNQTIKTVTIFDLLGRTLYQLKGQNSEETYNLSKLNHAIFIAKIELSNGAFITKKAIKK